MKIKMRTTAAGPAGVYQSGKEVDVTDEMGEMFIARGYAARVEPEPVEPRSVVSEEPKPPKETATAEPGENTMMDAPPKRRREAKNA